MMFIAQLKTAALITAACVVVAGGGAVVAKEMLTPPATPVSAQAEPKGLPPPEGVVSFTLAADKTVFVLAADKTVFVAKDPLEFKLTVTNVSRQAYTFTTGRAHYYWKYHIKAADRDAEYEVYCAGKFEAEPAPFRARLAPGEAAVQAIKQGDMFRFRPLKGVPSDTGKRNESLESARLPAGRYALTVEFDYRLVSEETVASKATLGPVAFTIAGDPETGSQRKDGQETEAKTQIEHQQQIDAQRHAREAVGRPPVKAGADAGAATQVNATNAPSAATGTGEIRRMVELGAKGTALPDTFFVELRVWKWDEPRTDPGAACTYRLTPKLASVTPESDKGVRQKEMTAPFSRMAEVCQALLQNAPVDGTGLDYVEKYAQSLPLPKLSVNPNLGYGHVVELAVGLNGKELRTRSDLAMVVPDMEQLKKKYGDNPAVLQKVVGERTREAQTPGEAVSAVERETAIAIADVLIRSGVEGKPLPEGLTIGVTGIGRTLFDVVNVRVDKKTWQILLDGGFAELVRARRRHFLGEQAFEQQIAIVVHSFRVWCGHTTNNEIADQAQREAFAKLWKNVLPLTGDKGK